MAPDDAGRQGEEAVPDLLWGSAALELPRWVSGADDPAASSGEEELPERDRWAELWGDGYGRDGQYAPDRDGQYAPDRDGHAPPADDAPQAPAREDPQGPIQTAPIPLPAVTPVIRAAPAGATLRSVGSTSTAPVVPPAAPVIADPAPQTPVAVAPQVPAPPAPAWEVPPATAPIPEHAPQEPVEAPRRDRSSRRRIPSGPRAEWVLHRVRVWSVAKLAFFVYLFLYAVVLGAAALLWWIAASAGLVHNLEKFLRDVGFSNFHFHGGQLMQGVALGGAVAVVAFTLLTALAMAVVNVISELSGGLRLVITEDRPRGRRAGRRRRRDGE